MQSSKIKELNMSTDFQVKAIPIERFMTLLSGTKQECEKHGARRIVANSKPGYPCRVSLVDAEEGEEVLLLPFTHHDVSSPYRAVGPIFVRVGAKTASPEVNEIPLMLQIRLLSIRAYDLEATMIHAEVVEGRELENHIRRWFEDDRVDYLHVHNARPGCYNCSIVRA
jgi:Protein of unknown function (DUF1203)